MYLIYDTETTGLPENFNAPLTDFKNWPRLVQLAWQIHDEKGALVEVKNYIVKPEGFEIPFSTVQIHGISTERAMKEGLPLETVLGEFVEALKKADVVAGHNVGFDNKIVSVEYLRKGLPVPFEGKRMVDTQKLSTDYCAIPGGRGGKFKWPKLGELHQKLFQEGFDAAHNASADVQATARCLLELIRLRVITPKHLGVSKEVVEEFIQLHPDPIEPIGLDIKPYHEEQASPAEEVPKAPVAGVPDKAKAKGFVHLHVHTEYSVLDGLSNPKKLMEKAVADGMQAVAITDHGNMFGAKVFHDLALKNKIKPILGCEVYIARRGLHEKSTKQDGGGWHLVLLAKNMQGYKNLLKLVTIGWTEGFYYKPRIDKAVLKKYSEGLIALTACLGGEIPDKIVNQGKDQAEEALKEYIDIFGEDLYLELQRHKSGDQQMDRKIFEAQQHANKILLEFAGKYHLKVVATNDAHFVNPEDADAHDRLICIGTAKDLDDPNRLRYTRQEWFKTQKEMEALFADIPEALTNTLEVASKVEEYELKHDPIMPDFDIPEPFENEDDYLRHLTYEGAKKRYGTFTPEITERIDFELSVITGMGYSGYFLIVWDFLKAAREMGVSIGPGRGSAAGSVVAYALDITQIDPLRYNLLFERFLNPDRVSMPDIDIDFDEDGRDKILEWVANKYGKKRVAHLITFGTMAAKMAIRDVARVQKLPLSEADRLAKLVPDKPGVKLYDAVQTVPELKQALEKGTEEVSSVIKNALSLEGSVRNTGTHACGIIIAKEDLDNYVPVSTVKGSVLEYATQFDGSVIEDVGLLKMDFLGLKTLSIIKDTLNNIKYSKGVEVDIDNLPLDDQITYDLYSRGETTGIFQFESDGMRKYLRELKPEKFEDLIAMVSLYRPGPMEYIPSYIRRKHGEEKVVYDLPEMEEILSETYGITVYQEQVMLLARKLAGFTRGQSDNLRKAMGKKKQDLMAQMKELFVNGCKKNGIPQPKIEKIWNDWVSFASYAFNKSHATCYAYVSYQTAYLKAHYPAEFMAAVLGRNLNNIDKITFFIKDAERMGIRVLGPDVNESASSFTVNKEGVIRFGMAAVKGVGGAAVEEIVRERTEHGHYKDLFDFAKRINLRTVNKRSFESLALAGAFDSFKEIHRAQYFCRETPEGRSFIESVIKYAQQYHEKQNTTQLSLFADSVEGFDEVVPALPQCEPWSKFQMLKGEKEVTGFYISGHPLDAFKNEMKYLCTAEIDHLLNNLAEYKNHEVRIGGMVVKAEERQGKNNSLYGRLTLEDFSGSMSMMLFQENYLKMRHFLVPGNYLLVVGKVEGRYHDENNLSFNPKSIYLLSEAMEKLAKGISVIVNPETFSTEMADVLFDAVHKHHGTADLLFEIREPETGKRLKLTSGIGKVDAGEFLNAVAGSGNVDIKVLT